MYHLSALNLEKISFLIGFRVGKRAFNKRTRLLQTVSMGEFHRQSPHHPQSWIPLLAHAEIFEILPKLAAVVMSFTGRGFQTICCVFKFSSFPIPKGEGVLRWGRTRGELSLLWQCWGEIPPKSHVRGLFTCHWWKYLIKLVRPVQTSQVNRKLRAQKTENLWGWVLCRKPLQREMVKISEAIKLTWLPLPSLLRILKIILENKFIFVQSGEAVIIWE